MDSALTWLKSIDREIALLDQIISLLHWDQEIWMPPEGVEERGKQKALLSSQVHRKLTDSQLGAVLSDLGAGSNASEDLRQLPWETQGLIRYYRRKHEKLVHIPVSWVEEFSEVTTKAHAVWIEARKEKDYSRFQPYLEQIVQLVRRKSELLGYKKHPYDPLLDEYEPGADVAQIDSVFSDMTSGLKNIISRIGSRGRPEDSFLYKSYDTQKVDEFSRRVLRDMGFDFRCGRLDESAHPFTITLGSRDVRMTTRYTEPSVLDAVFSAMHEGGHALYEQNSAKHSLGGTGISGGASMAMHESQSRMWENLIGRSREFWQYYYPIFQSCFPEQTDGIDLEHFLKGINSVQPSCIRVNADEVTYGLHVVLRYELEKALLTGDISTKDLPALWNKRMNDLVGITPPDDSQGVLQDMHWSAGMFGYFPTYALGNLYAAQLFAAMKQDIPAVNEQIARGEFSRILQWLTSRILQYGAAFTASELLSHVSGESLDARYAVSYLEKKYAGLLGI